MYFTNVFFTRAISLFVKRKIKENNYNADNFNETVTVEWVMSDVTNKISE